MSRRSITIESLSVEALASFKRVTKALPGAPNEVAKRILDAGLEVGERMVVEHEAKAAERKAAEAKAALESASEEHAAAIAEAQAANAALEKATTAAEPEAEAELEVEEL